MAVPGMVGGEQRPLLKYNAKTREWQVDDRIVTKVSFLADLDNAETGWLKFGEGIAPDFRLVPMASLVAGSSFPLMPADVDKDGKPLFKRGFRMMTKISDQLAAGGPTVREFAGNSLALTRAVDRLHTAWLANRQDGKVPLVTVTGYEKNPGQYGANYEPTFEIVGWRDRPRDLVPASPQPSSPTHVTDPIGEPEVFDEDPEDASFT